jgi:subtilase family serine protease
MRFHVTAWGVVLATLAAVLAGGGPGTAATGAAGLPQVFRAPGGPVAATGPTFSCQTPSATLHCYSPAQIRAEYGVDGISEKGDGQTIVLVDSYGSPTAAQDLQTFHDTFFPSEPEPSFEQIIQGPTGFSNSNGNGKSGSAGAAGWSGEATLDIEWAYAIAPHAHIVLLAVPPAETEGAQGFPNLFKAISDAVATFPAGTVFSMSLGVTEQTFGGAAAGQTAKFDSVFQHGIAKGDTFFAASGDNGTLGTAKQQKNAATYATPTVGWPASSPYVTAVGGTQLQDGWAWNPTSDVPFLSDGSFNPAYFASTPGGDANYVWNESWLAAASGGGPSAIYARPSWQTGVLSGRGDHRLVPDVSWNAAVNGGVLVYISAYPDYNGPAGFYIYGGTSAATPQVAALTALANQRRAAMLKAPIGNANPAIYGSGGSWFHDVAPIVQGTAASGALVNNQDWDFNGLGQAVTPDPVAGWQTTSGYDLATGWGTPWAPSYVAGLAPTSTPHLPAPRAGAAQHGVGSY